MTVVEGREVRRDDALPALGRLVPDAGTFADDVWGRTPLLTRAADLPGDVADLFGEDAVDELVSTRGLRTPFLRVAKDGSTLPGSAFTAGGGVGAGIADQADDTALTRLFADGATIVLQALHRTWPALVDFSRRLGADLGHPVQVNAYVTPPQSQGFDDHYDVHDVFVLQVSGEKRWRIHAPVLEAPLRDQPWTQRRAAVARRAEEDSLIEAVLRPGDCLYLPRGTLHAATALGDVSTHLTFGVHTWTHHQVAEELAAAALRSLRDDVEVRRSLPMGRAADDPAVVEDALALVRRKLLAAVDAVDAEAVEAVLRGRVDGSARPAPVGPLAQLRLAQGLDDDTVLVLRDGLRPRRDDAGLAEVPDAVLEALLAGDPVDVARVGQDAAGRLVAAGTLVRWEPTPDVGAP